MKDKELLAAIAMKVCYIDTEEMMGNELSTARLLEKCGWIQKTETQDGLQFEPAKKTLDIHKRT